MNILHLFLEIRPPCDFKYSYYLYSALPTRQPQPHKNTTTIPTPRTTMATLTTMTIHLTSLKPLLPPDHPDQHDNPQHLDHPEHPDWSLNITNIDSEFAMCFTKFFAIYYTFVVKALRGETDTESGILKFLQNLHEERSDTLLFNSIYFFKLSRTN